MMLVDADGIDKFIHLAAEMERLDFDNDVVQLIEDDERYESTELPRTFDAR